VRGASGTANFNSKRDNGGCPRDDRSYRRVKGEFGAEIDDL